mgnify:CR=1 FL=1|jgi:hypothetical protein
MKKFNELLKNISSEWMLLFLEALIIFLILIEHISNSNNIFEVNIAECLTVLILAATLFFVIKYTKAAEKQTETFIIQQGLSILPSLAIEIRIEQSLIPSKSHWIRITNVGNSAAVNIKVESIADPTKPNNDCYFEFHKLQSVSETIPVILEFDYKYKEDGHLKTADKITKYNKFAKLSHVAYNTFDIKISFQDIQGNHYKQVNRHVDGVYYHGIVERVEKPLKNI